jgi:hypothetical protein
LSIQGRQPPGHRFVIGVTSLSSVRRYDLDAAALQTSLAHPDLSARFTDATGREFVSPNDAGLRKGAALLTPDTAQHTWSMDDQTLSTAPGAYPGTMPVYADIPTTGVPIDSARHLATFLRYAATDGVTSGTANGQLPAGYLPLTKANGLGDLANYTLRAARAVAGQTARVPPLVASASPSAPTPSAAPGLSSGEPVPGGGGSSGGPVLPAGDSAAGPTPGPSSSASPPTPGAPSAGTIGVRAVGSYSQLGTLIVPIVLVVGALSALVGSLLRYPAAARSAVTSLRRLRVPRRQR